MKSHLLLLTSLMLVHVSPLRSQDVGNTGQLRVVNAIALDTPVSLSINQHQSRPQGYPAGFVSGNISFKPGKYIIRGSHPDIDSTVCKLTLKAGEWKTIILYLTTLPPKKSSSPPRIVTKSILLDSPPPEKNTRPTVTLLSVCTLPLNISLADTSLTLNPLTPQTIPSPAAGSNLPILAHLPPPSASDSSDAAPAPSEATSITKEIGALSTDEPDNRYIIFYDKADGAPASISYQN